MFFDDFNGKSQRWFIVSMYGTVKYGNRRIVNRIHNRFGEKFYYKLSFKQNGLK